MCLDVHSITLKQPVRRKHHTILYTNIVCRYCIQTLSADIVYKHCLQILYTNIVCNYCLQTLSAENVYKHCLQILYTNIVCRYCIHTLSADIVYKHCLQILYTNIVILLQQSIRKCVHCIHMQRLFCNALVHVFYSEYLVNVLIQ